MAEAERLSIQAESVNTDDTTPTVSSSVVTIDPTGTNPLPNIYNTPQLMQDGSRRLGSTDLPSRRLQFSQWHELRRTEVKGPQLKAPRIRAAPPDKERDFYELVDEDDVKIHHELHGRQRKQNRDNIESWEHATMASFTRQELHHSYQKGNLSRILRRLQNVVYLNLMDNELLSMTSFSFPRCEYLNIDSNFLTSLRQLPKLPKIKHLSMQDNGVTTLQGLDSLKSSPIEQLYLSGNPVAFKIGYRYMVFSILPHLVMLDGTIKQEEDLQTPDKLQDDLTGSSCVVS